MRTLVSVAIALVLPGVNAAAQRNSPNDGPQPTLREQSPAVAVARAHIEAWSHHDWEKARRSLAPDVHVTVATTVAGWPPTDLTGVAPYMEGLRKFAEAVVPGSARINASLGDEHNALIMVTVRGAFGPGGTMVTLPAARLYLLDDNQKIKVEQVVFFAVPERR